VDKKIAVIYTSKYGSTQTYAEWIAWEVRADLFPARGRREDLLEYDVIVYGGYVRANGIAGLEYIKKNFDALNGRRLIVFAVGIGPVRKDALDSLLAATFTPAERRQISVFGLRGAFNFNRLRGKDRIGMSLLRTKLKLKHPDALREDERALLDAYDSPVNFTDEKAIAPIVRAIQATGRPISLERAVRAERTARLGARGKTAGGKTAQGGTGKTKTVRIGAEGKKKKRGAKKAKRAARKEKAKPRVMKRAARKTKATKRLLKRKKSVRRARPAGKKRAARKTKATKRLPKRKKSVRRARPAGKKRAARKTKATKRLLKRKKFVRRNRLAGKKRAARRTAAGKRKTNKRRR
jgi:menaquinone-dependent protoporphyrinogen IX oxidase